jgi:UDP-N-acetyl-D-mannosaminuronic acid dehydrogenase
MKEYRLNLCPERIAPGKAIQELIENARIAGGFDPESAEIAGG